MECIKSNRKAKLLAYFLKSPRQVMLATLKKKGRKSSTPELSLAARAKNEPSSIDGDCENDFDHFENAPIETTSLLEDVALRKERVSALEMEIQQKKSRIAALLEEISELQKDLQHEFQRFDQHLSMRQLSTTGDFNSLPSVEEKKRNKKFEVNITEKEVRERSSLPAPTLACFFSDVAARFVVLV